MQLGAMGWALAVGAALSVQVGLNAILRAHFGHAAWAAFVNFGIGTVALLVFAVLVRAPAPTGAQFSAVPWWALLGGFLGALYVASSAVLGPQLGVAVMTALVVAGQMFAALLIDHYGWLGFQERPATVARILGALLVVVGVVLLSRG